MTQWIALIATMAEHGSATPCHIDTSRALCYTRDMMRHLYEVQRIALEKAEGRSKFGYFLDMGLGKTMVALTEFERLFAEQQVDVMMVFCPNSLIGTWRAEITKHDFQFKVVVKPESLLEIKPPCVILYNYESIIATAGKLILPILTTYRTYAAFDESVQVKNFKSARWKKIKEWFHSITITRLLSGRPMVLSPMDLWTQMTMLGGRVSASPFAFRNTYCRMGGWMNKVVIGVMNGEQLTERLQEISWTATKRQWTDLPEKSYTTRRYELTDDQKAIYKKMFNDMIVELNSKPIAVQQAVHKYSKLQQVGSGFMIDEEGEATPIMEFKDVPKVKLVDELLCEASNKVLIFAHYRASVEALAEHYLCPVIRGGMTEDEISGAIAAFNDGPCQMMVCQVVAAKYGLTLLGNKEEPCHTTIYFENTYQLDARIQSEDRNHRHGQKHPVLYVDLVGTAVDSRIIASLQKKDDLSKTILGIKDNKDEHEN